MNGNKNFKGFIFLVMNVAVEPSLLKVVFLKRMLPFSGLINVQNFISVG